MIMKIFDSELKVMEILWENDEISAGKIVKILKERIGWNPNTTYTVIKKLIDKGAVERREPGFICKSLITKGDVQHYEAKELLDKLFDGSADVFLSAFLNGKKISDKEIERLKQIVQNLK